MVRVWNACHQGRWRTRYLFCGVRYSFTEAICKVFTLIYTTGDPFGLRYLFQLRLSLIPLRSHKFHHNFIDTPSDNCHCNQGVEDTRHFLLACPLYVTQRVNLLTRINEILQKYKLDHLGDQLNLYLYSHNSINFVDNRDILISTLNYIKETRRFST